MKFLNLTWKKIVGAIFSIFVYLTGGFDSLFQILFIFIILDYITGILKSLYNKEFKFEKCIKGTIKKLGYLFVIIIATQLDKIFNDGMALRSLSLYYYISYEALSILENWGKIGLPLPKKLLEFVKKIKKEN